MLNWLERYVGFSRRELKGIAILCVLLIGMWIWPYGYSRWQHNRDDGISDRVQEIEAFLATVENTVSPPPNEESDIVEYFPFNPNGLAVVDWKRLGLSERQIRMIKNYEAKGGRFRRKEDLKKIYAIQEADYIRLEPYIRIPQQTPKPPVAHPVPGDGGADNMRASSKVTTSIPAIELNAADSTTLQQLPGIGPVFASRIVRFRDLLGGFHHILQLTDVYGFDTVRFNGLRDYVYVDSAGIRKIPLNSADYRQLNAHPFISSKLANAIVQYRKQHGPYRAIEDLLGIAIMDEVIFSKIAPYLTVSE